MSGVTRHVAFLRAVNLGKRRVVNARLVELFEQLGYADVWTHINSGNVAFDATGRRADLERTIGQAIEADVGFEVTTFVRTAAELRKALALQPFDVAAGDTYFVTFLLAPPTAAQAEQLEALSNDFDTLEVHGREVHWLMHGKSSDSTLVKANWEKILGPNSSTSRNTTMLRKLVDKLGG
jgi:uncharacterized protein (DUF1697 family)